METWTAVRFLLYPVLLGLGLAWSLFHLRLYRQQHCVSDGWAFWLGVAIAINGAAGLLSLLVARLVGFGPLSSAVFTMGPAALVMVTGAAVWARFREAWRR